MTLRDRLKQDMKTAMRAREQDRLSVIRLLISTIKNKEIGKGKDAVLTEEDVLSVVVSSAKQRKESIVQYEKADRQDLADKELAELKVLQDYLPAAISEADLKTLVRQTLDDLAITEMKQLGKVMKVLVPSLRGKADGDAIRAMVQLCLQEAGPTTA